MSFHLLNFLPYLLNQAAEAVSSDFQSYYRDKYGMLRTEWRVLFHLGSYDAITAKRICEMASLHKTKVSRAVHALEKKRFLKRINDENDRRIEHLELTSKGVQVFADLRQAAAIYQEKITQDLTLTEVQQLHAVLQKLAGSNMLP